MSRKFFAADGMLHTRPMEGENSKKRHGNKGIFEERRRLEAEVCVNCEYPNCKGTVECMRKRKKEREKEGK